MKIADMHCDTISGLYRKKKEGKAEDLHANSGHIDIGRLKAGGALIQNFALFVNLRQTGDPWGETLRMADFYYSELKANEESIAPVYCYADIERRHRQGKIAALLTVEEGGVCGGEISRLEELYRRGVRMMTLTWNYPNEIGYPALNVGAGYERTGAIVLDEKADQVHGLTSKGREMTEAMEQMGMIVDVSHLSDGGFYDVLECTKKPFAASHSNARTLCPRVRNLTDDMIRRLAERGGVIGLNFCPDFLTKVPEGEKNEGTIEAVAAHAAHIIKVGGVECPALGSDFDGMDGHGELPDYSFMPRLADAFRKAGLGAGAAERICYKNVLGFYKELL